MSTLKVESLRHIDADSDALVLSSNGTITFNGTLVGATDSAQVQSQFDSAFPSAFDTRFALQDTHDSAAVQAQIDSAAVTLTGNQTVAGIKTFSDSAVFSSNVGIGIPPDARLHVYKNNDGEEVVARFENRQNLSANTASSLAIRADQAEARIRVDRDGAGNGASLVFGTTNAGTLGDRVTINASGNVGIGKTPVAQLDVANGTTYTASGDFLARIQQNTNATGKNGLSVMNAWAATASTIFECAMGWDGASTGYYPVVTVDGIGRTIFKPSRSEKVRIDTDGIKFNGDTAAANALDDYEEGTWTPAISSGATVNSYTVQNAVYVKIGRLVHIRFYLQGNITATGGILYLSGLPFNYPSGILGYSWLASGQFGGNLVSSADGLVIQATNNLIRSTNLRTSVNGGTAATIEGVGTYYTNA